MKNHPLLEISEFKEELDKCVNCGLCQSVCPTFLSTGHEGKTARGKIVLLQKMLEGSLDPSESIADWFDDCLACYACQTVCPAGVRTEKLWTSSREELAFYSKRTRYKRTIFILTIKQPVLFNWLVRLGGWFFGFNRKRHEKARLRGKIAVPFRGAPYALKIGGVYEPEGRHHGTVALLLGCSANIFTPWIVDSTIKILNLSGFKVIIPKRQVCCGAPAINNADWKTARILALKNIELFNSIDADYITSCDATCANAMRNEYRHLFHGEKTTIQKVESMSKKVRQLGSIINSAVENGWLRFKPAKTTITIHDSCHSTHTSGKTNWRTIVKRIPELDIVEMEDGAHCCGFGGSYSVLYPETADDIAKRKIDKARKTGVKEALVGSPGCLLRLNASKNGGGDDIEFKHAVEFLADYCGE